MKTAPLTDRIRLERRYETTDDGAGNLVVYRDSAEFTTFVNEQFGLFKELLG